MTMPPGLPTHDSDGNKLVCKLNRSLYGLKQAGREWATLLADFLLGWGFKRSAIDVCLFTYDDPSRGTASGASRLWVLCYVDDILIADNDDGLRTRFVDALSARFPTEDKGPLSWILGIAVCGLPPD